MTTNLPDLFPKETIRVQPFSTSSDFAEVSPIFTNPDDANRFLVQKVDRNNTFTLYLTRENLNRMAVKALFPPSDNKWYLDMIQEGHDNAASYLQTLWYFYQFTVLNRISQVLLPVVEYIPEKNKFLGQFQIRKKGFFA